ncbi:class I SAM-dependent methyltransferase [Paenibacillus thermotolerans]|uniref:class I SAM-dependent methyltransferase n=1 Tax=Paenibacillus thermotolerans TaxID=3027807 RepID=UPI0023681D99|nr:MULTISPECIES: class I SAM-dependent methyltransferase [unclassified Paenibacillus]
MGNGQNHYYSKNPTVASDRDKVQINLRGFPLTFITDAGVFSKHGIDFGSRLLIETMHIPEAAKVLDVGCGYGPIGICAAMLANRGSVTMIDINERAVRLAKENAERNGIRNAKVLQSDKYEAVGEEKFDVILTNPPIRAGKSVVHDIFEGAVQRLNPGGSLWVVIQKKQGAPSAFDKLESLFDSVEEMTKDKGYRIFRAVKR